MNESIAWIILFVVLLIIECVTLGLTTIWFAGGALAAFVASFCGGPLIVQIALFVVVSLVLLFFTRPVAVKYFNKDRTKTNIDSLIGQTGVVKEEINNLNAQGLVLLNGQEWTARSNQEAVAIKAGAQVEVLELQGVKLIVKEKNGKEE